MIDPFRPDLLRGKTTVITGGGSGLGRSMALRLAGLGAKVAVLGRRPEPLQQTARAIRQAGGAGGGALRRARPGRGPRGLRRGRAGARSREPAGQQRGRQLPLGGRGPLAERLQLGRADRALRHVPLHDRARPPADRAPGARRGRRDHHHLRGHGLGVRRALGRGEGRRAGDREEPGRRMGVLRHPPERRRPRSLPHRGRVQPAAARARTSSARRSTASRRAASASTRS